MGTKHAFSDDAIGRLYSDYRSAAYNQERISYEPTYAVLAQHVGASDQEVQTRVGGLTAWLADEIDTDNENGFSMLDFGGSDGRFLPKLRGQKYVFEISNSTPLEGIVKISDAADLATYSYVQMAHVLEHVPEPLTLLKRVSSLVKPSGYLYIEVPQELTDAEFAELKIGTAPRGLGIHEHINFFCVSSITSLAKAAQLDLISIQSEHVNLGYATCTVLRALCQHFNQQGQRPEPLGCANRGIDRMAAR